MIRAKYDKKNDLDAMTKAIMKKLSNTIDNKDDDCLILCTGTPGTGKSSLMMHCYELFDPEGCSVDAIGLNRKQHALALQYAAKQSSLRFCGYDEANVSRRNAMTTENKDLLALYWSNRGDQMFHWWNNPSAEMLDKPFIEERIKGLIIIATKDTNRARIFYYFTKKRLLDLLEDHGNLKHRTLIKHHKKYALYQGWFRKYDGVLYGPYLEKKKVHRDFIRDDYIEKYATGAQLTQKQLATKLNISPMSIMRWHKDLEGQGKLIEGKHFTRNAVGHRKYNESAIDLFQNYKFDDENMGES